MKKCFSPLNLPSHQILSPQDDTSLFNLNSAFYILFFSFVIFGHHGVGSHCYRKLLYKSKSIIQLFLLPTKLRRASTDPVTSTPVIRIKLNSGNFVSVKNYRGLHLSMRFWLSEKKAVKLIMFSVLFRLRKSYRIEPIYRKWKKQPTYVNWSMRKIAVEGGKRSRRTRRTKLKWKKERLGGEEEDAVRWWKKKVRRWNEEDEMM